MNELYHYGVPGMKWGVRKKKDTPPQKSTKKSLTTGQKAAIGAAVTAGILATAWAGYTVAKAYNREMVDVKATAKSVAKALATAKDWEVENLGMPKFDEQKYKRLYKENVRKNRSRTLKKHAGDALRKEVSKQGQLLYDVKESVRQRVAPDMFDMGKPKSLQEILDRYNNPY